MAKRKIRVGLIGCGGNMRRAHLPRFRTDGGVDLVCVADPDQESAEALIQAMRAGDFYASSGVVLKTMECSETAIDLEIEPAGDEEFTTRFIGTMEGYNDHCEVVKDSKGKEVHATLRYSDEVGQVLATVKGLHPRYKLTGKELYVRAEITSTGKPTRAVYQDQLKKAWTQPVGWRKRGQ